MSREAIGDRFGGVFVAVDVMDPASCVHVADPTDQDLPIAWVVGHVVAENFLVPVVAEEILGPGLKLGAKERLEAVEGSA